MKPSKPTDDVALIESRDADDQTARSMASAAAGANSALDVAREAIYSPLETENLSERAARRIAEAIGLGLLEVGERLPSEAELASRFGIAPMTLRESLSNLKRAGCLETRRGRHGGTFVRRSTPQPKPGSTIDGLAELDVEEIRDFTELRVAVSGAVGGLAAEHASDDELSQLHRLVELMAAETSHSKFRHLDTRFHLIIASASRSPRLTQLETSIQSELLTLLPNLQPSSDGLGIINGQHRAIVSALYERESESARREMEEHARASGEYLVLAWMGMKR